MQPPENRRVLAKMPLRVAADGLVIGYIGLLKIRAGAHQQELNRVIVSAAPVELRGGARAFTKIKELLRLGRIQVAAGGEAVHEEVVAQSSCLPAVVRVEVVIIYSSAAEIHVPVSGELGAGSRGDVQHAAETVAVFGRKSAGHQVHGFENLRAHAGRKLRLCVIQEGDSIDELVQRKLRSADGQKVVVTVAGAGHQVVDQLVGVLQHRFRQPLQVLPREGVRTPGFLRIDGQVVGLNVDTLP